jgi:hypothetical protein
LLADGALYFCFCQGNKPRSVISCEKFRHYTPSQRIQQRSGVVLGRKRT